MKFQAAIRTVIVILAFVLFNGKVQAQQIVVDTKELETLAREWNNAHNVQSIETFHRIYGDKLLYYTQSLSKQKSIELKQSFLKKNGKLEQRIVSSFKFTPYTTAIIKCDFKKAVFTNNKWREFPSYLLFSYTNRGYKIVGESDYTTDRTLKYVLNTGDPMDIPVTTQLQEDTANHSISNDSSLNVTSSEEKTVTATLDSTIRGIETTAKKTFNENIVIPKVLWYALIGVLFIVVMLVMIYQKKSENTPIQKQLKHTKKVKKKRSENEAELFENFVVTLFDPLHFNLIKTNYTDSGINVDLKFEHIQKDLHSKIVIKCLYIQKINDPATMIVEMRKLRGFVKYSSERNLLPYFILGAGGAADDPKEIFLIPLQTVTESTLTYQNLLPFKKSGMFYYNTTLQQIK